MMFAYALRYGEQEIPYGFVRRGMVLHPPSSSRTHQRRAPQASWLEGDPRRRLLRPEERLSLATIAPRVPALEDRLRLVQEVAHRRYLRAPERRTARTLARTAWKEPQAQRRDSGLPVGQDHGRGRPRARLRPGKAGCGQKAPPLGGHRGSGAPSAG